MPHEVEDLINRLALFPSLGKDNFCLLLMKWIFSAYSIEFRIFPLHHILKRILANIKKNDDHSC